MSSNTINVVSMFSPAVYLSKIFGLLPADLELKTDTNGSQRTVITFSKQAFPWTAVLISMFVIKLYNIDFLYLNDFIPLNIKTQFIFLTLNDLGHIGLISISCFFFRFWPTFNCLNTAIEILQKIKTPNPALKIRYIAVILSLFSLIITICRFIQDPNTGNLVFHIPDIFLYPAWLSITGVIASINITGSLSYKFINKQIKDLVALNSSENQVCKQLKDLLELHWETGDLILLTMKYFSSEVLVTCICLILRAVNLAHITYNLRESEDSGTGNQIMALLEVLMWFTEVFVLGKICEDVEYQCEETKRQLYKYQQKCYSRMGWKSKQLVEAFILQMESRSIQFSPHNLFVMNRALSYNMASIIIAYVVLLVQFHRSTTKN